MKSRKAVRIPCAESMQTEKEKGDAICLYFDSGTPI